MIPFTKKYVPKNLKEVVGQEDAVKQIKEFLTNFKEAKKNALWLYGPSGTGKTSSVYAAANELDLELIEINSSDFRNKEQINSKVGAAVQQQSLFFKQKVILVDDVDGLSGNSDRGGMPALIKLIEESSFPMILTAQNPFDFKFNKLKSRSILVEFKPLDYKDIFELAEKICKTEKIKYEDEVLKGLARRAGGDCRAALNDLQTLSNEASLTKESLGELNDRAKLESMPSALLKVFKTTDPKVAIKAFESVKEDIDQQFLWIDENLPYEYSKASDLAEAYDKLSKADVFKRRIRRWQHWRFLVYINALITAGIAVSKDEKYKKFVKYKPTGRILKLWWAKQKSLKKKAISAKIAHKTHSSTKEVLKNIEFFKGMFKNKEMSKNISEYLDLDKEEVAWLKK